MIGWVLEPGTAPDEESGHGHGHGPGDASGDEGADASDDEPVPALVGAEGDAVSEGSETDEEVSS